MKIKYQTVPEETEETNAVEESQDRSQAIIPNEQLKEMQTEEFKSLKSNVVFKIAKDIFTASDFNEITDYEQQAKRCLYIAKGFFDAAYKTNILSYINLSYI